MSLKKAQNIANQVQDRLGISLTSLQNNEVEWLKNQLDTFLDLEIETDELSDPDDLGLEDEIELNGSDEDVEDEDF
jgi:hypothetical protein